MKRTNIELDQDLVAAGLHLTGLPSRKALVDHALRELVRRESQLGLLKLKGQVPWEGNLSEMRRNRQA